MYTSVDYPSEKASLYHLLASQLSSMIEGIPYPIGNFANASALLADALEDINWVGFYFTQKDKLILGPFQGKIACVEIPFGSGVCGTAAVKNEIQLVPDVHKFPGHIACDSASNSEIVLPLCKDGKVLGVLDIDSPTFGRFTEEDKLGLSSLIPILEQLL